MTRHSAQFRFYAELNDFLAPEKRRVDFHYFFNDRPAIKDAIEALGVPHTEVDLILVHGRSVSFRYRLKDGDRVSVYPVFESLDIRPVLKLRARTLRRTSFILDVHLGKLSRLLRMLGMDAIYRNDFRDEEIIEIARAQKRIILTRDRGLLKHSAVTHGYCIRSTRPTDQILEVLRRFDLKGHVRPFGRCILCNGEILPAEPEQVAGAVPPRIAAEQREWRRCRDCGQIYWKGSHYERMCSRIEAILRRAQESS